MWTDETQAPWRDAIWDGDVATVTINLGDNSYQTEVTRCPIDGAEGSYFYTFQINGAPYFAYEGPEPTKEGQQFIGWRQLSGGSNFTVTDNAVFAAQFQANKSYVFNVYFYNQDGTKAASSVAITKSEQDIVDGNLTY